MHNEGKPRRGITIARVDGNTACVSRVCPAALTYFDPLAQFLIPRQGRPGRLLSAPRSRGAFAGARIPVIIFSHFSTEIILETNGPLKPPDRIINLGSRMPREDAAMGPGGVDERLQRP